MNKRLVLLIAACTMASLSACNESVPWSFKSCDSGEQICDRNAVYGCIDGRWAIEVQCSETETLIPYSNVFWSFTKN